MGQIEDKTLVTEWINKNVVVVNTRSRNNHRMDGVFFANNLCHLAAKNNSRGIVKFLVCHCGADLSSNCLQIVADGDSDADIEPSDSLFTVILNSFHEPVEFLKELLKSGVAQSNEDGTQLRKTFTFGTYN